MAFNAQQLSANAQMFAALATNVAAQARAYLMATRVELVLVAVSAVSSPGVPQIEHRTSVLLGILVQGAALFASTRWGSVERRGA
jgi:hypothetical protein